MDKTSARSSQNSFGAEDTTSSLEDGIEFQHLMGFL